MQENLRKICNKNFILMCSQEKSTNPQNHQRICTQPVDENSVPTSKKHVSHSLQGLTA
jgi:hypothetical protein